MNLRITTAKQLLTIICCALCIAGYAQTWNWAKGEGDIGNDAANSITLDDNGNAYVTGNIAGRADFSGTIYQGRGIYEVFIAKYDPQGNLLWVKLAGGDDNDQGNAIRYRDNAIYITGFFSDTAYFENTMFKSRGESDAFVAKYDLNGNLVWARQAGGTGLDYGSSVDVDNSGNVFIAGTYESAITVDTFHLSTNNIYSESFFAKYDVNGNLIWAKTTTGNNANLITGLAFDNDHSVFITGYFGVSFKIDNTAIFSSSPSYDIFLAKINDNGSLQWLKKAGSNYEDASHGVCSDKNGNPTIIGYYAGTATFGNNTVTYFDYNDIFVAHYDSSGNNLWVRTGEGNKLDVGFGVAADDNGNVFATGMFQNTVDFDGHILTAGDVLDRDIFVVSYDKNGNMRWITRAGAESTQCGLGIDVAPNGVVAITGYYLYYSYFGSILIDYASANDLFIAEYKPPVVNGIDDVDGNTTVSVYPNPANDYLIVKQKSSSPSVIKVFDAEGRLLDELSSSKDYELLNTSSLSAGVYLLSVENNTNITRKRFVVSKH